MDLVAGRQVPPVHAAQFRTIFRENVSYVTASLLRIGIASADCDDLTSEVFVRVHKNLAHYDASRPIKPWLFAYAVRVASEHRKKAHVRREILGVSLENEQVHNTPESDLARERERARVLKALDSLDLDQRAVFVLHELDETPIPEVARALGIPEGTAYTRLRAARAEFTAEIKRTFKEKQHG
jgi:RNA polymerase sigma-70 factor, ECF subfamily